MTKSLFALAAALALPLSTPVSSQVPVQVHLDSVTPATGSWSYQRVQGGSHAAFADSGGAQRLILRCNLSSRTVSIVRTGVPAAAPTLSIWTSSTSRSLPSRYDATKSLSADVSATDALLDAMAFSRGRFATAAAGAPLLGVPSGPQVDRVVEDCRS